MAVSQQSDSGLAMPSLHEDKDTLHTEQDILGLSGPDTLAVKY